MYSSTEDEPFSWRQLRYGEDNDVKREVALGD